jgi:transcriptional regulator with XRE-family HTH domain
MGEVPKQRPKLPKREAEICARLKDVRLFLRLTQKEFAAQIGIKRTRLASIEEQRAPLKCDVGLRACRQFQINEEWLATGADFGLPMPFGHGAQRLTILRASDPVIGKIPPGALFSTAFDGYILKEIEKHYFDGTLIHGRFEFSDDDTPDLLRNRFGWFVEHLRSLIPAEFWQRYYVALTASARFLFTEFTRRNPKRLQNATTAFEKMLCKVREDIDREFPPKPQT